MENENEEEEECIRTIKLSRKLSEVKAGRTEDDRALIIKIKKDQLKIKYEKRLLEVNDDYKEAKEVMSLVHNVIVDELWADYGRRYKKIK